MVILEKLIHLVDTEQLIFTIAYLHPMASINQSKGIQLKASNRVNKG